MFSTALRLLVVLLPWPLRRHALQRLFGYRIDRTARIGWAWVFPRQLVMEAHATIGHLTACVHLDAVTMGPHSSIGRGNWITGFPTGGASPHSSQSSHFAHQPDREASLTLGAHAAITNRHLIDCTHRVWIGNHTTIAGWQSQLLTHSIDLAANRQSAAPITIGERCFVGTNAVLLPGAVLPDRSVLGAKSLLNKAFTEPHTVYAGVPARAVRTLPPETAYFHRTTGFVD